MISLLSFVQIEPPAVPGGDVGWSEWCSPGGHAVGNPDVPVWEKRHPPVSGKSANGQLKAQEKQEERLWRWSCKCKKEGESKRYGEYESSQRVESKIRLMRTNEAKRLVSHVFESRLMSVLVCAFLKTNSLRRRDHNDFHIYNVSTQ